jgi:hypothetical protein
MRYRYFLLWLSDLTWDMGEDFDEPTRAEMLNVEGTCRVLHDDPELAVIIEDSIVPQMKALTFIVKKEV